MGPNFVDVLKRGSGGVTRNTLNRAVKIWRGEVREQKEWKHENF